MKCISAMSFLIILRGKWALVTEYTPIYWIKTWIMESVITAIVRFL